MLSKNELNKQKKLKSIYSAAVKIFSKNGYYNSKISQIAEQANVADGTIYLYFKNKDDLFIKVFTNLIESKLKYINKELSKEVNSLNKLHRFFELKLELIKKDKAYTKFFIQEMRQNSLFYTKFPDFKPVSMFVNYLETLIEDCILEGSIRKVNPHIAAIVIFGSVEFAITDFVLNKIEFDIQKFKNEMIDILHNGFKKPDNND